MKTFVLVVLWTLFIYVAVAPIYMGSWNLNALVVWAGGIAMFILGKG